ncbi:acetylajmalan esterase-like isoform X2 [Apium graveolens]|uniref:acetylajmalan esterase-like isoform X2 n=1 Tax=Apium graveolens TaxID=4045 RepID=UPI003D7AF832
MVTSRKVVLFQLLIIFCCLYRLQAQAAASFSTSLPDIGILKSCNINQIYQFGASKSDTGNRRMENPAFQCNLHPYGLSFFGEPTGRCSDGLLMIDYIASAAGIPFLNPYLNSTAIFSHGVDFAVSSSTALPVKKDAIIYGTRSSLDVQLNWMSKFSASWCSYTDCSPGRHMKNLFIVGETGYNDYTDALLQGKTLEEIKNKLMPQIVQSIMDAVLKLIGMGAVRIIVPGQFPLGCFPMYLTNFPSNSTTAYDTHQCLKAHNDLAADHNKYLQHALKILQKQNPKTKIVYCDYYNAFKWLLTNAPFIELASSLYPIRSRGMLWTSRLLEFLGSLL